MNKLRMAEPAVEPVKLWCETCEGAGKVYQEHQDGCWAGGHHTCPDCGGKGYDFTSPPPASEPAAHVSNNGRGYPWERDGVLTPIYSPQQLDEVIEGSASAHYASWDSSIPSPTEGMNIVKRIHHVGGRNNAAGFVEFGSIQAVQALVRQVLRDLPPGPPADVTLLTDDEKLRIALECNMRVRTGSGAIKYASAIEQVVLQKAGLVCPKYSNI